jgi:hypothetical protein
MDRWEVLVFIVCRQRQRVQAGRAGARKSEKRTATEKAGLIPCESPMVSAVSAVSAALTGLQEAYRNFDGSSAKFGVFADENGSRRGMC